MAAYERIPAADVEVGMVAYPRGVVVSVERGETLTTIGVQGYDRWNLQAVAVTQYGPRRSFKIRKGQ